MYDPNRKFKIFYIEYDEDGNEIGRGVYPKEYVHAGNAYNVAYKHYGDAKRFKVKVAPRDPWQEYYADRECDICGKTYTVKEELYGHEKTANIDFSDWSHELLTRSEYYKVCPECFMRVRKYVANLRKKGKKNDKT